MRVRFPLPLILVIVFLVRAAVGQSPNGTMSGLVLDPAGRAIPDAQVLILNDVTGVKYQGATNGEGIYAIPNLPPGPYRLQVSKVGFKTLIKPDVVLNVQDALAINFTLPVGAIAETVTVEGGAPLVNTQDAAVSTVINREFVENIPLNGRSFNTLMLLTPGVVLAPNASIDAPGQFSINGQRTNANIFRVDGVSANFGVTNTLVGQGGGGGMQAFNAYGGTASLLSVDAMQEFRIETSTFAPEYGRTPGGQVNITSRSGTNQFHGDVFEYFRNTALDANDWFANNAHLPRAPEHQNDFGGVVGGPIFQNKTFFFFSYEGLRLRQPKTSVIEVPSHSLRQNPATVPAAAAILNAYPLPDPNAPESGDGNAAQFTGNYSDRISMNAASVRIDQVVSTSLSLFGRFNQSPSDSLTRIRNLSTLLRQPVDTTTLTLGANAQPRKNATNELRFNYSRQKASVSYQLDNLSGAVPPDASALLPPGFSSSNSNAIFTPFFDGIGGVQLGSGGLNTETQWNLADDFSLLAGSHQLKFGVDYNRLLLNQGEVGFGSQYIALDGQNFASTAAVPFIFNTVVHSANVLLNELSLYAQDRWHIGQRLTLTYGLRWDLSAAATGQNTILASWQNVNDPPNLGLAPLGTPPWKTTYYNFAPRLGLTYRVAPKGDLVLRAGTGVFYDLGTGNATSLARTFPNAANFLGLSGPYPVPITNPSPVTPSFSLQPPFPNENLVGFSPNLKLPYSHQWNVAIEKSFQQDQSLSVTYVGQIGRRLLRAAIMPSPNANFSADNGFFLTENADTSSYNALQVQFKKVMSHGIQALLGYTWSHSLDTSSNDSALIVAQSFVPVAGERGSSDFDVRHTFTGAVFYSVPSFSKKPLIGTIADGWSLTGFVAARSGFPINVFNCCSNFGGGLGGTTRPDFVSGQPVWTKQAGTPGGKVLNPNAFATPVTARQGTLPRNWISGFGATQFDTSLARNFAISDRTFLQFRADVFNVFNHPNFANPQGAFPGPQFGMAAQMLNQGLSSGAGLNALYNIGGPRSIQLALKFQF